MNVIAFGRCLYTTSHTGRPLRVHEHVTSCVHSSINEYAFLIMTTSILSSSLENMLAGNDLQ